MSALEEFGGVIAMTVVALIAYVVYGTVFNDDAVDKRIRTKKANLAGILLSAMIGPLIFGFLDNFGMMIGTEALEGLLPKGTPDTVKAMAGNTFSDAIGAFMGFSISGMITSSTAYDEKDLNIWARPLLEMAGIVIGCLVPIAFYYAKQGHKPSIIATFTTLVVYLFANHFEQVGDAFKESEKSKSVTFAPGV